MKPGSWGRACFWCPAAPTSLHLPHSLVCNSRGSSRGRTWDAVIDQFAARNIPIRTIERVSGLIVTDQLTVGREGYWWANCGKGNGWGSETEKPPPLTGAAETTGGFRQCGRAQALALRGHLYQVARRETAIFTQIDYGIQEPTFTFLRRNPELLESGRNLPAAESDQ